MSYEKLFDQVEDGVDPRVQVELEKLNSSTDEINRLEVDLDEARNQFRQLLRESTVQIESCARKLGTCIVKVKPYYDARIQAKEALQETQKAAASFERANSAHAAAKEMVFLAEEGLKAEGRTFDHAWQEMLNHATMRVNDSESERMKCEAEHKKTSQLYQLAEIRVHALQKELKRAITKSRPYFELKIHYNQLLQTQNQKVKALEKQVAQVKLTYAHTLKNLEQISDEIHKNRQNTHKSDPFHALDTADRANSVCNKWLQRTSRVPDENEPGSCAKSSTYLHQHPATEYSHEGRHGPSSTQNPNVFSPLSETVISSRTHSSTTTVSSENSLGNLKASPASENDSSFTGPPDTESEEETFKLSNIQYDALQNSMFQAKGGGDSEAEPGLPRSPEFPNPDVSLVGSVNIPRRPDNLEPCHSGWTEINLRPPEVDIFTTVKPYHLGKSRTELEQFDIPYAPLAELEGLSGSDKAEGGPLGHSIDLSQGFAHAVTCNGERGARPADSGGRSQKGTPKKLNIRRQSLDVLWNSQEKVKEILSQSIMKLNIGTLTEKKPLDTKVPEGLGFLQADNASKGNDSDNQTSAGGNSGMTNRRPSKAEDDAEEKSRGSLPDSQPGHLGGFMSRKDRFFTKKIPSPLERTLNYLNTDDDSNSDSESLASLDAITDEQLSSLVLDKDLTEIYQDAV